MANLRNKDIINKMKLEDKVCLCSGANFWETEEMKEFGIKKINLNDGPNGLRRQEGSGDNLGLKDSIPATCFPTAVTLGSSWNTELVEKIAGAIGEEALEYGTDIVLGPGVNIKRNPLCGRNFEYFSEDPYLSGMLGISWIRGIQSKGVAACLKHIACNNQEKERYLSDSIVDERAFREIYLKPFEMAIKEADPSSIMSSYNKINGTYASDNIDLFRNIIRNQWGYNGLAITDWGGLNNRVQAFKAGIDLEMPWSGKLFDRTVIEAVKSGLLAEEYIDEAVDRIITTCNEQAAKRKKQYKFNREEHYNLAMEAAVEGAVLLKNEDNILPLDQKKSIAVIGALASRIRYQGAGSSHINPTKVTNLLKGFSLQNMPYKYYQGYEANGDENKTLLSEAVRGALLNDIAVVVMGLTEKYESEGYDRLNMRLPQSNIELLNEVYKVNKNIIVVLLGGSPVEMEWINEAKAVLNMYLGGEAVGESCARLLLGVENPSGKLAETYPVKYEDCASSANYVTNPRDAEYRESIYVGYRYYEKAKVPVRFPFGFGLSYSEFKYSALKLSKKKINNNSIIQVTCKIKNISKISGAEIVQLYVKDDTKLLFKPEKELQGFKKVFLKAKEEKKIDFFLHSRSFAHYSVEKRRWSVLKGYYDILICSASDSIQLSERIYIDSPENGLNEPAGQWYLNPVGYPDKQEFEMLLGRKIAPYKQPKAGRFDLYCTLNDMKENLAIRILINILKKGLLLKYNGDESNQDFILAFESMVNTPVIRIAQVSGGSMPLKAFMTAIDLANKS